MAAVLEPQWWSPFLLRQVPLPVNWWMTILPEICHSCNIQVGDMSFHPFEYFLQYGHLGWIWPQICLILDGLSLMITLPTRIPLSTTEERQKPINFYCYKDSMMLNSTIQKIIIWCRIINTLRRKSTNCSVSQTCIFHN